MENTSFYYDLSDINRCMVCESQVCKDALMFPCSGFHLNYFVLLKLLCKVQPSVFVDARYLCFLLVNNMNIIELATAVVKNMFATVLDMQVASTERVVSEAGGVGKGHIRLSKKHIA